MQLENEEFRVLPFLLRTIPQIIANQRYLAYTSEVGESFRPLIPKHVVNGTYAASLLYVGADVAHNFQMTKEQGACNSELALRTTDKLIWHGFASMLLPALSVHSIVSFSGTYVFNKLPITFVRTRTWAPTVLALASIPFIIHPLDHLTDFAMDNTIRKCYPN